MAEVNINLTGHGTLRRRSAVACRNCNQRKVRCNVTQAGFPCSNCLHDAAHCEVVPRKKHRPRRTRALSRLSRSGTQDEHRPSLLSTLLASEESPVAGQNTHALVAKETGIRGIGARQYSISDRSLSLRGTGLQSTDGSPMADEGDNSNAFAAALDAESIPPDESSLNYIGDKRGAGSFLYDLCHPGDSQEARHVLLPRTSSSSQHPHELEYLNRKGAFLMLPDAVSDDLIHCYFEHVHFFLPIIDAANFLTEYTSHGFQNLSLLLVWSMFLAAANFAEVDVLQGSGYSSRKAMKRAMYERAKALYDADYETDKVLLIQSVILMGFWYTDTQDRTGAWHWIGIAISLSQTLGLHRCPRLTNRGQRLSEARQRLFRRIWWACFIRDRWLSLAKGRPMRIHDDDCDMPMPAAGDIIEELDCIPIEAKRRYIPADSGTLAQFWIRLVMISAALGNILRVHYRANSPKPSIEDIERCAEELQKCSHEDTVLENLDDVLRLHEYQLQLFYEASVVVLYRPYVLKDPAVLPLEAQTVWQKTALDRARKAASNTNSLLEKLINIDAVHYLRPMIITTLIPPMQIHLFDCKSSNRLTRALGSNKLELCMLVLSELRETYWGADFMYRLFEHAQLKLSDARPDSSSTVKTSLCNPRPKSNDQSLRESLQEDSQQAPTMSFSSEPTLQPSEGLWPAMDASYFSAVEQLLSPGFSLSGDVYQYLLTNGENGLGGYGHAVMPVLDDGPMGFEYSSSDLP